METPMSHNAVAPVSSEEPPKLLYKILSLQDWEDSQTSKAIKLSKDDDAFIHFSTEEQLGRILGKYWLDKPAYVVLKVDVQKLPGDLVFETNPGGSAKYYHLYNGSIPLDSVVEAKVTYQQR